MKGAYSAIREPFSSTARHTAQLFVKTGNLKRARKNVMFPMKFWFRRKRNQDSPSCARGSRPWSNGHRNRHLRTRSPK
ncbi:hypothetical protein CC2G_000178 [Coprinopsis cinerea AmutBmut pab1-1]|nr:hypothetical protein CC2G_000178 [Coprinopsis cinerea AmutBmut pab1-1]